jgi:hypothetical protein
MKKLVEKLNIYKDFFDRFDSVSDSFLVNSPFFIINLFNMGGESSKYVLKNHYNSIYYTLFMGRETFIREHIQRMGDVTIKEGKSSKFVSVAVVTF